MDRKRDVVVISAASLVAGTTYLFSCWVRVTSGMVKDQIRLRLFSRGRYCEYRSSLVLAHLYRSDWPIIGASARERTHRIESSCR